MIISSNLWLFCLIALATHKAVNSVRVARTSSDDSLINFLDSMLKLNNSFPVDFGNDFLKNLFDKSFCNSGL